MLIFDSFPTIDKANEFVFLVHQTFGLNPQIFDCQDESNQVDFFPFKLIAPIVLVERGKFDWTIIAMVEGFGEFAGT